MKRILILLLLVSPFFLCLKCNKCPNGVTDKNQDIPLNQKNALFHFPDATRWIFKSNEGDMDTVYLGPLLHSYSAGTCDGSADCCTKLHIQKIRQNFTTIPDSDGLEKVDYYYDDARHWLIGKGGSNFEFSTDQSFSNNYKSTLTVNATLLSDVESQVYPGPNLGDAGIDAAYWSLTQGLVRYDYQKTDGSFIIYERQDL